MLDYETWCAAAERWPLPAATLSQPLLRLQPGVAVEYTPGGVAGALGAAKGARCLDTGLGSLSREFPKETLVPEATVHRGKR